MALVQCPKSVEAPEIQFKFHDKFVVFKGEEATLQTHVNLLATASNYGLMFVGSPNLPELKVIMLKDIVECKASGKPLHARLVQLPDLPIAISVSSNGTMLAVNYKQNSSSFLQILYVPSLTSANVKVLNTIRLSADLNIYALQLLWNPVLSNSLAVVLSNGALSMYTLQEGDNFQFHSLDKQNQVKCGCWSPKGKQIVLGFSGGKLIQYKPDLTPAKTIPGPANILPDPFDTVAIHWLSTFQFAVVFLQQNDEAPPSLYIVNAPKGGTPCYINYYDICYSNLGPRPHQITFTHIQPWNLLLVTSANGVEIGLLGTVESGETPTWVQYVLLDEARIEMPLTEEKDETYPIGVSFDTSSVHQLTFAEKKIPVMPMIHILSTHGELVSFNFLNLSNSNQDVCSPSNPISDTSGMHLFRPIEEFLSKKSLPIASSDTSFGFNPSGLTSTPAGKDKNKESGQNGTKSAFSFSSSAVNNAGGGQQLKSTPLFDNKLTLTEPSLNTQPNSYMESANGLNLTEGRTQQPDKNKPLYTVPPTYNPPPPSVSADIAKSQTQINKSTEKPQIISSEMDEIVKQMIAVQINSFNLEIQHLGNQSKGLLASIGHPAEMKTCTKRLNDLQEICEQAKNKEFEIDVQNLRHSLNEAYVMLAECRSKLDMYNNPDIARLTKVSSHDPVNRRQLAKIQCYIATNQSLMQQLQQLIDEQWSSYQDLVHQNSRTKIRIPCLEGIYQRMTKLKDLATKERNKITYIKSKLRESGLLYANNNFNNKSSNAKGDVSMESLVDSILSMSLAPVVEANCSKLSKEKLNSIMEILKDRKIGIIKPQRPDRIGLKSEVILETKLLSDRKTREGAATNLEKMELERMKTSNENRILTKPTATKPIAWAAPTQPFSAPTSQNVANGGLKFGGSSPFVKTPSSTTTKIDDQNKIQADQTASSQFMKSVSATQPISSFGSNLQASAAQSRNAQIISNATTSTTKSESMPSMVPISFSAKVIDGNGSASPFSVSQSNNQLSDDKENTKLNESKPFSLSFGENASQEKPYGGNLSFGGFTLGNTSNSNIGTNKSSVFDPKLPSAGFSFGGSTIPNFASNPATTTTTTNETMGTAPLNINFTSTSTSDMKLSTTGPNKPAAFTGFGKTVGTSAGNSSGFQLGSSQNTNSGFGSLNFSATTTSENSVQPPPMTTSNTKNGHSVSNTDPTDSLFGTLNICKPSSQESGDSTKSSEGNTIFGFGSATPSDVTTKSPYSMNSGTFAFTGFGSDLDSKDIFGGSTVVNTTQTDTITTANAATTVAVTTSSTSVTSLPSTSTSTTFSFSSESAAAIATAKTPEQSSAKTPVSSSAAFCISSASPLLANTTIISSAPALSSSSSMFGGTPSFLNTTPASTATAPQSVFGSTLTSTTTSSANSIFAGAVASTANTSVSSSGNIFSGIPKPEQSLFSSPTTAVSSTVSSAGGLFAGAVGSSPSFSNTAQVSGGSIFSGSSGFGGNANTGTSIFGGSSANANPFGAAPQPAGASIFASTKPADGNLGTGLFGSQNQPSTNTPPTAGGGSLFGQSAFGQSNQSGSSIFGGPASNQTQSAFGSGGTIFGNTSPTGGTSIFGGGSATAPAFGSPSAFGSFSGTPAPAFGAPAAGSFAQGGPSIAQSGFGSPQSQPSFAKPLFGNASPVGAAPAFGSPPTFGAQPSFGGAPTFGSPKGFGTFSSTPAPGGPAFAAPTQKNNLFEALGSTDTGLSFGNLAHNTSANTPKPSFGGSSFMNYRA